MIDFLNFNASAMFSEYYTNSNEDISPDYDDNFGGWVMSQNMSTTWGKGSKNNNIGWGQAAATSTNNWGKSHYISNAGQTDIVGLTSIASFSYSSSNYCISGTDPTPTITGTSGGAFTAS